MDIHLTCRHCEGGGIVFHARPGRTRARVTGRCQGCRRTFSRYGGRVIPVEAAPHPEHRWAFTSVVAEERARAQHNDLERRAA